MNSVLCLIGDVMVDVTMGEPVKMRLGGIMHAARACWALGIPYHALYIAPDYLKQGFEDYAFSHGALSCDQIGRVNGCPNVIVVREATEAGSQGYEYLLREEYKCEFVDDVATGLPQASDFVVFPGSYDLAYLLKKLSGRGEIAVDIANWNGALADLQKFEISTVISSTSSPIFLQEYQGDVTRYVDASKSIANRLVFKENRGGSRIMEGNVEVQIGAHLRPIVHSVGVGDVFNVAYLACRRSSGNQVAGNFASRIAAEYAATTYPDIFKAGAESVSAMVDAELSGCQGVRLPWDIRAQLNIYIAAPDFDYNDPTQIDAVANALTYHNFTPRLPVRENGQAVSGISRTGKIALYQRDMELLDECHILIAILLDSDPGTLVELGMALGLGKPSLLFDPFGIANNVMLECAPTAVCTTLDDLISAVFSEASKVFRDER